MRLPRDLSGRLVRHYGLTLTRTSGSHMTVTRVTEVGKHSVTVSAYRKLCVGTLNAIVNDEAEVVGLSRRAVRETLFG